MIMKTKAVLAIVATLLSATIILGCGEEKVTTPKVSLEENESLPLAAPASENRIILRNPNAIGGQRQAGTVTWTFDIIGPERTAEPGEWVQWRYKVMNSPKSTDVLNFAYLVTYIPDGLARPIRFRGLSWDNTEFPPPLAPGESFEGNHVAWHVARIMPPNEIAADIGADAVPPAEPPEILKTAKINVE
jgi:hypothetical protein